MHDERQRFFETVELPDWRALQAELRREEWLSHRWAFRGLPNAEWPLCTTIEQLLGPDHLEEAGGFEYRITREFVRRAHHYLVTVPARDNRVEWLALMQHHGAPTRLLDWTYSFDIALHFAFRKADRAVCHAAIWAINLEWVRDRVTEMLPEPLRSRWKDVHNRKRSGIQNAVLASRPRTVIGVTPFIQNERLSIQQGTFLVPGDVSLTFEQNLRSMGPPEVTRKHVRKYRFPLTGMLMAEATRHLQSVNITEATLFPGLDGYARSLSNWARTIDFTVFERRANVFSDPFGD